MAINAHSVVQNSTVESSSKRRTIIKGAAWSVPVIAAAVAAPSASASPGTTPVPERLNFTGTISSPSSQGVVRDITFTQGNVTVEGPAGTGTGEITMLFTFPDGYTTWDPVAESFGWTVVEGTDDDGFMTVTATHPGISVTTAGAPASAWFAGIVIHGTGATTRNRAWCTYYSENQAGLEFSAPSR